MVVGLELNRVLTLKSQQSVFHYHMHVRTELSELMILISIDNVPTRINRVKTIGLTTYLHSLDIFKMVYIDVNQMSISFEYKESF